MYRIIWNKGNEERVVIVEKRNIYKYKIFGSCPGHIVY